METVFEDQAAALRLRAVDGGWEPEEGVELVVVIDAGSSAISLDRVTRIVTVSDAWIVCQESDEEVAWVRPGSIVMIRSRGSGKNHGRSRPGF